MIFMEFLLFKMFYQAMFVILTMTREVCWVLDQDVGKLNVSEFVLQSELCQNVCLALIIGVHVVMA